MGMQVIHRKWYQSLEYTKRKNMSTFGNAALHNYRQPINDATPALVRQQWRGSSCGGEVPSSLMLPEVDGHASECFPWVALPKALDIS